ncbi:MAG TPA: CAP domain-containing protein [Gammaproteobacteria bacterium]
MTQTCDSYVPGTSVSADFVCAHNHARSTAEPTPVPVLGGLTWNAELATVAQAWAESCTWSHNADRSADYTAWSGAAESVGENLYMSTASEVTPDAAVASWAAEAQFYDYATNSCASGEVCGHYTQLMWRDTLAVGCGTAFCGTLANSTLRDVTLVVCDYAPGGNIDGMKPY